MRILHLIYDDIDNPWVGGGGATRTFEIYGRIAELGHPVNVVCGNYPGIPRRHFRRGVLYRHVGSPRTHFGSRLTYMLAAARLIKRGGYDIVIEDVSPYSPVGAPLWKPGVPAVANVQNISGLHATRKYGLLGLGPKLVEKPLLSLFTHFVASSPGIAAQLRDMLGRDIDVRVIPNSADAAFYNAANSSPSDQEQYILTVCRIDVYQKGLDLLIEAFDRLADRLPNLKLLIAGSGAPMQMELLGKLVEKARHSDRIELLGHVDAQRAAQLMRGALMVAMPSRYEAWPLVAIEAAAVGAAVVGTDIVGVRDAAPQYPHAHSHLVPPDDVDALVEAMHKVATDELLRRQMSLRGREWAANFTWDAPRGSTAKIL